MKLNCVQLFAIAADEPTANIVTDRLIIRPTDRSTENKQSTTWSSAKRSDRKFSAGQRRDRLILVAG